MLAGAVLGYILWMFLPQYYTAVTRLSVSIDYNRTGKLEDLEEDTESIPEEPEDGIIESEPEYVDSKPEDGIIESEPEYVDSEPEGAVVESEPEYLPDEGDPG